MEGQSPGKPTVPRHIQDLYARSKALYVEWMAVQEESDAFLREDDEASARSEFFRSLEQVVDACTGENPGIGRAVVRKAGADYSELNTDPAFSRAVNRLDAMDTSAEHAQDAGTGIGDAGNVAQGTQVRARTLAGIGLALIAVSFGVLLAASTLSPPSFFKPIRWYVYGGFTTSEAGDDFMFTVVPYRPQGGELTSEELVRIADQVDSGLLSHAQVGKRTGLDTAGGNAFTNALLGRDDHLAANLVAFEVDPTRQRLGFVAAFLTAVVGVVLLWTSQRHGQKPGRELSGDSEEDDSVVECPYCGAATSSGLFNCEECGRSFAASRDA